MVTHSSQYYDDEEPSFHRRYNGRGHGYPITHDRDLPSRPSLGPYGGHRISHDSRSSGQNSEQDQISSNPRRRIPVAVSHHRVHLFLICPARASPLTINTVRSLQKAQDSLQWRSWKWRAMPTLQERGKRYLPVLEGNT